MSPLTIDSWSFPAKLKTQGKSLRVITVWPKGRDQGVLMSRTETWVEGAIPILSSGTNWPPTSIDGMKLTFSQSAVNAGWTSAETLTIEPQNGNFKHWWYVEDPASCNQGLPRSKLNAVRISMTWKVVLRIKGPTWTKAISLPLACLLELS